MSFNTRIGTEIAGYRLERQLGQGAFAAVYVAEHIRLGNKVAMKVLDPTLARDEGMCSRFIQESRIAAELDHPGIIPILNAGEQDGLLFIVMKYVQGRDLYTLIREQGTLSATRTSSIIDQIAGGLDAAHSRGLVHRDIKPQNILIEDNTERAYVIDFGIVKRVTSAPGLEAAAAYTSIGFKGTAHYAPPEQINGLECDARTDVYALGGVVYECLTGQAPYGHLNYHLALQAQIEEPPPSVVAARPELPYTLDTVVTTAMAKRPDDRYSSCGELASALRAAAHGRHAVSTQVVPPEPAGSGYLEYPGALTVPPIAAVPGPAEVPASQVSPPQAPPPQVPPSQFPSQPPSQVPDSAYRASEPPPAGPPPSAGAAAMDSAPPAVTPGHPGGPPPPSTGGGGGGGGGWDGGSDGGGSGRRGSGGGREQGGGLSDSPRWLLWVAGLGVVAILALAMAGAYQLGKGDDKAASGDTVTTQGTSTPDTTATTTETTAIGEVPAGADADEAKLWTAIPKPIRAQACDIAEPEHAGGVASINCDYTDPNHGRTLIHLDRFVDRSHLNAIYKVHGLGGVSARGGKPDPKGTDTGKCNGVGWLGEATWRHEEASDTAPPSGRSACYQTEGTCDLVAKLKLTDLKGTTCSVVVWTNYDGNLFVKAEQQTDNHSGLFGWVQFWRHRFG